MQSLDEKGSDERSSEEKIFKKIVCLITKKVEVEVGYILKKSSRGGFPIRRVPLLVQFPIKVLSKVCNQTLACL